MELLNRARPGDVGLETALPVHGVPRERATDICAALAAAVESAGSHAAFIGVLAGRPVVGLTQAELRSLLDAPVVAKTNTANFGVLMHRAVHAATTVSTTMELATAAGLRVVATGGLGGVHRGYADRLDISADLAAFTRFPVAVVTSGVKSLLDVESTREAFEALGVPIVGYRTDAFPAFYLRTSDARVDARFDDPADLADFVRAELARTGRGIVVANPVPHDAALDHQDWDRWLALATASASRASGRDITPAILAKVHELSGGRTLEANIALAVNNARLAGEISHAMATRA
ncbi:MAG: pseudouridine-5'-phosphate glycosidase [Phycisphaerales bacterium]